MKKQLQFSPTSKRSEVFEAIRGYLIETGFRIVNMDDNRPWGGFYYIDEEQSDTFIKTYFSHLSLETFTAFSKLSPKILLVAPGKRLSWQYHYRRSEIWKMIGGRAAIMRSETDEPGEVEELLPGSVVTLKQGERHRLIGANEWGIVAEIWKHIDSENPSDEEDIVRVQDDYGR